MSSNTEYRFRKLAVIGAGNMGSGIAQKMATEGFPVVLVDLDDARVERGLSIIRKTLEEGVERRIFKAEQAEAIRARVEGSSDWNALADCDLVVEAVFEDEQVKRDVFARLDRVCRPDAILATNTSSLSVTRLAESTAHPERVIGLHYFYHPAKNRLVEVVAGERSDPRAVAAAWTLQEQLGKTPIASADVFGFVVNRFFVPWLNEAVRLLEEDLADIPTIEAAAKATFGVGMGPFELMNVTGVPIAQHAATTLGDELGPFYAPTARLRQQVEAGELWDLTGDADPTRQQAVADRLQSVVFHVAAALVDGQVGTLEDTDIGARVGLRWPRGPFEMINRVGVDRALGLVKTLCDRWEMALPGLLSRQATAGKPFSFRLVRTEIDGGVATLTINRPDAMNALNESVVAQLHDALREAQASQAVEGIVIAGAGKAFIAGADIRFFVKHIEAGSIDRIVEFTEAGHRLLADLAQSKKPVVARMHGLALGGGLELALACRRIVASRRATMAFPETGIGIYPGLGGTQRTPRRTGPEIAKWLIYTGEMISADVAGTIGLVDAVVDPADLDRACRAALHETPHGGSATWSTAQVELAQFFGAHSAQEVRVGKAPTGDSPVLLKAVKRVAGKAPVALRLAEKLIDAARQSSLEEGLALELAHLPEIFATEDAYEGLSTLGKRPPIFKGR